MDIKQALDIINQEYDRDDGLLIEFRMSADVDAARLEQFIEAVGVIDKYYEDKTLIEKDLVYRLLSFYTTLNASAGHWKVSRPKGLDKKTVFEINMVILDVFASGS